MRIGMDAFVSSTRPKPKLQFESSEIKDKDSIFVAAIYPITSAQEAREVIRHHRNIVHGPNKAAHEIAAWRYMDLKTGKSGTGGPNDFEVKGNYDDDNEKYGGNRILKVMQSNGIIDAVVIVSRW
jgi:putative IMPACT (imprinted ancient) family translation regulator